METPIISVIVPVFNSEKFLDTCISSILSQTFKDFELLLINDGSEDDSLRICKNYALKDKRIRVLNKKNGGVSTARNLGLREAIGEWAFFVDSDDVLYNDALSYLYGQISVDNIDFVTAGYEYVNNDDVITFTTNNIKENVEICSFGKGITNLYDCKYWQWFICSKLFRLSIIRNYKLFFKENIYFAEDRLFIIEYLSHIKKNMSFSSKSIYKYKMHSTSASAQQKEKKDFNEKSITGFKATVMMYKEISKCHLSLYNKYLASVDVVFAYYTMKNLMSKFSVDEKYINERLTPILLEAMTINRFRVLSCLRLVFNRLHFLKTLFKKLSA